MAKKKPAKSLNGSGRPGRSPVIRANVKRETFDSPDFVTLYANDTEVQISPWDVRFIFGEIDTQPDEQTRTIRVKRRGQVRISPQHAKRLLIILASQIKVYESTIGPIPLPKG